MHFNGDGVAENTKEAIKWFKLAGEQGDVKAQLKLGYIYYYMDKYIPQDYKEAFRWFGLASEQGDAEAQLHLGLMYSAGKGVLINSQEAIKYFQLSAEQGNTISQGVLDALIKEKE